MRDVKVTLDQLLDIVVDDFGYNDEVLFSAIAQFTGIVSDNEIAMYAAEKFLTEEARSQGYTHEDYTIVVTRLTEWRDEYCPPITNNQETLP